MAEKIRTRTVNKNIKALDKTVSGLEKIKRGKVQTKETAKKDGDSEHSVPEGYAQSRATEGVKRIAGAGLLQIKDRGIRAVRPAGKSFFYPPKEQQIKPRLSHSEERERTEHNSEKRAEEQKRNLQKKRAGQRKNGEEKSSPVSGYGRTANSQEPALIRTREEKNSRTIRTAGQKGQSIKLHGRSAAGRSARSVKTAEKTAKTAVKTSEHSAKMAAKAAKASAKEARKTVKAAEELARTAVRAAVAVVNTVKTAGSLLLAAILSGGWVVVILLILILVMGGALYMIGGDNSSTVSEVSREVKDYEPLIRKFAKKYGIEEYVELIKAVMQQESGGTGGDPMQSSQGDFNTKYPHTANAITEPEYSIDCGIQELKSCLESAGVKNPTDMEHIRLALQGYNYGNGYIAWAQKNYGGYTLANAAEFSEKMMKEKNLKNYGDRQYVPHVLRYYSFGRVPSGAGNQAIVRVALSQEGKGGETYWRWYGFNQRVSWCACYVSWCAEQCGYLESGAIPKFSLCSDGVKWFEKKKQFQDGSYVPAAGDIIFFDWGNDGTVDHVGIVEKVKKGTVYTVEGNSSDKVMRHSYSVGSEKIYGYGIPT